MKIYNSPKLPEEKKERLKSLVDNIPFQKPTKTDLELHNLIGAKTRKGGLKIKKKNGKLFILDINEENMPRAKEEEVFY